MSSQIELTVSQFVAVLNQTLEYAYPSVTIVGELANFRVSKNRWVYFDLKDDNATVKFFGNVYNLPGPLENGMLLKVIGQPRLHNLYGFSVNVLSIQPAGEGSIRRAADLLRAKLQAEGLFDPARKRPLAYPPKRIGLVTSKQSAAYADFIKVINARWVGLEIELCDVQVQGEAAPAQIVDALERFNGESEPPDLLVIIRGGGSAEDLSAFNSELVTRAVAVSRVPTLVAIGHETDISLSELAADQRASTPSNAAELLVPDKKQVLLALGSASGRMEQYMSRRLNQANSEIKVRSNQLQLYTENRLVKARLELSHSAKLLTALSPTAILRRGYAIVRSDKRIVRSIKQLKPSVAISVQLSDGKFRANVSELKGE